MINSKYKIVLKILFSLLSYSVFGFTSQPQDSSQTSEPLYDGRVQLTFGLFLPSINSTAQLNTKTGNIGTIINLETAFRLPETQNLFRFNGLYRFNNRHSAEGYYYALNRSGSNVTKDSLIFGGLNININSSVDAFFNATLYGAKYRYSVYNEESVEVGFSAGLSFLDVDIGAEVELLNHPVGSEEYNDLLFLPVFGFFNRVKIIQSLIFRSNVDMFALNIKRYDGVLFDFSVSLEYLFLKRFSLGFSYNVFSLNIKFNTSDSGRIGYSHKGLMFFGKLFL
jgi:hypothetical protein